jgi:hypothetical protein
MQQIADWLEKLGMSEWRCSDIRSRTRTTPSVPRGRRCRSNVLSPTYAARMPVPSWYEIAQECAAHPELLRSNREREFVNDMLRRTVHGGELTEKQAKWLRDVWTRIRP